MKRFLIFVEESQMFPFFRLQLIRTVLIVAMIFIMSTPLTRAADSNPCDIRAFLAKFKSAEDFTRDPDRFFLEFESQKRRYADAIEKKIPIEFSEIKTFSQELALIEASSARIASNPLDLERILHEGSRGQKKSLLKALKGFKKAPDAEGSVRLMNELYKIANPRPSFLKRYVRSYLPPSQEAIDHLIQKRIESAVLHDNLVDAFSRINLIKDPKVIKTFHLWQNRTALKNVEIFKYSARMTFRGLQLQGLYMIYRHWNQVEAGTQLTYQMVRSSLISDDDIARYEAAHFQLDQERRKQLESSLKGRVAFHHPLDPEVIWKQAEQSLNQDESVLRSRPQASKKFDPKSDPEGIHQALVEVLSSMIKEGTIQPSVLTDFETWYPTRR